MCLPGVEGVLKGKKSFRIMAMILYLANIITVPGTYSATYRVLYSPIKAYFTQCTSFISAASPLVFPLSLHIITLEDHSLHLSSQHV